MEASSQILDIKSICAFVDVQGFCHDGRFITRELAISVDGRSYRFDIVTGLKWTDMTERERRTNAIVRKFIGLDFETRRRR